MFDENASGGKFLATGVAQSIETVDTPTAVLFEGGISYVNAAFTREYGESLDKSLAHFFNAEHLAQLNWLLSGNEADKIVLPLRDNIKSAHAGRNVMVQIWPIDRNICLLALKSDYSIRRLADLDELTRLPNRRKARMLLDIEMARANRASHFCLTLADIDHFKPINDTHGHDVGDRVLQHVTDIMTSVLREGDWVARWGGEEFLIFTGDNDVVTGMQPIERIRSRLKNQPYNGPPRIQLTMSFGITSSDSEKSINGLINKADSLLYEAKRNGRDRIECESSDEIVWIAENIRKVISDNRVGAQIAPARDWSGNVAASVITPSVQGISAHQTDNMLTAAQRLKQQALIDYALMKNFTERYAAAPPDVETVGETIFVLRRQLYVGHEEEVSRFFARFPNMLIGIDADDPLPPTMYDALDKIDRPVAIVNYNFSKTPSFLLGIKRLAYLMCSNIYGVGEFLRFLREKNVRAFFETPVAMSERQIEEYKTMGFSGFVNKSENGDDEAPAGDKP